MNRKKKRRVFYFPCNVFSIFRERHFLGKVSVVSYFLGEGAVFKIRRLAPGVVFLTNGRSNHSLAFEAP